MWSFGSKFSSSVLAQRVGALHGSPVASGAAAAGVVAADGAAAVRAAAAAVSRSSGIPCTPTFIASSRRSLTRCFSMYSANISAGDLVGARRGRGRGGHWRERDGVAERRARSRKSLLTQHKLPKCLPALGPAHCRQPPTDKDKLLHFWKVHFGTRPGGEAACKI